MILTSLLAFVFLLAAVLPVGAQEVSTVPALDVSDEALALVDEVLDKYGIGFVYTCYSLTYSENYQRLRVLYEELQELERHPDAARALLKRYSETEICSAQEIELLGDAYSPYMVAALEILLSQSVYQNALYENELLYLTELVSQRCAEREMNSDVYNRSTYFSLSDSYYVSDSGFYYIGETLSTPDGTEYTAYAWVQGQDDIDAKGQKEITDIVASSYNVYDTLDEATAKYNCHSYAGLNSTTGNMYFLPNAAARTYSNDTHTIPKGAGVNDSNVSVGDIVLYVGVNGDYIHSAIVTSVSGGHIICVSKWGEWGLYEHDLTDVPYTNGFGEVQPLFFSRTSHSFVYEDEGNMYSHTKTCTICDRPITEQHEPNSAGTHCVSCGASGPFTDIMRKTVHVNGEICQMACEICNVYDQ